MRKKTYKYYRGIRTTAERRANQENEELIRAKRINVPDPWDADEPYHRGRSWKDKRKDQHRGGARGKKHVLTIPQNLLYPHGQIRTWELEEWFTDQNIPHEVKHLYKPYWYKSYSGEMVKSRRGDGIQFIWWSDKDIGINFILKGKLDGCDIKISE